jgi:hypothetical protein
MASKHKHFIVFSFLLAALCWAALWPLTADAAKAEKVVPGSMAEKVTKPKAVFDADKMGDMSD